MAPVAFVLEGSKYLGGISIGRRLESMTVSQELANWYQLFDHPDDQGSMPGGFGKSASSPSTPLQEGRIATDPFHRPMLVAYEEERVKVRFFRQDAVRTPRSAIVITRTTDGTKVAAKLTDA